MKFFFGNPNLATVAMDIQEVAYRHHLGKDDSYNRIRTYSLAFLHNKVWYHAEVGQEMRLLNVGEELPANFTVNENVLAIYRIDFGYRILLSCPPNSIERNWHNRYWYVGNDSVGVHVPFES